MFVPAWTKVGSQSDPTGQRWLGGPLKRTAPVTWLCVALALAVIAPLVAGADKTGAAILRKVASRVNDRAGVIAIEASDPVPYVASQPDPRTFVIELRDVVTVGFDDAFKADPRHIVSAVQVENAHAFDGASVTRVRLTLSQAARPRVRSSKNVIFVETDRLDRPTSAATSGTATTMAAVGAITFPVPVPAPSPARQASASAQASGDRPATQSQPPALQPSAGQGPQAAPPAMQVAAARGPQAGTVAQPPAAFAQAPAPPAQALAPQGQPAPPAPTAQQPTPPPSGILQVPSATQQPLTGTQTRYTGVPVSLDFQGADLRAVLRTFAEISGLNIVIDPTIQGTVDVALRDVPWDQALDIILRANKLGYVVDGTIVRIAPLAVLADEEAQRQKLAEAQALAGELQVLTRSLSYARAEDLRPLLTATVLSQRGSVQTDVRTNTLIITDLPDRLQRASALLGTLDRPEPQVEIEARIVQTTREFARQLGVQWGVGARASNTLGNTLPLAFPNQGSITGRTGGVQGADAADAAATAVNLGVNGATTAIGLALGSINGAVNLDIALSALERQGQGRLLSTPRVSTQNNVEAEITQGIQIPIQTVANNTVTVTFKDAALTLRVTPQITAANTVIMRINVENAAPDFSRSVNNIPPIDTQRAITQVLVANGETTVIGGIYISREQATQDRTPALYRLPLLGWLFKRDVLQDDSRELLIFITPRILSI
jgi:type IV pilus assembly protein PilQ